MGLVELLDFSATVLDAAEVGVPEHHQGKSLRPVIEGSAAADVIRESVRCEYFDSLDSYFTGGPGAFATMYRRGNYKLSIYHGFGLGELYDLSTDPWEHDNLWNKPESAELKAALIAESFDQHVLLTTDVGSRRVAPM